MKLDFYNFVVFVVFKCNFTKNVVNLNAVENWQIFYLKEKV